MYYIGGDFIITEKMKKIVFYMKKSLDNNLKEYNLTTVQLLILMFLNENSDKEIIQKNICEHLSLKHSTVIEIIKKLELKKFVNKDTNHKSVLTITKEGKKLLNKIGANKGFIENKLLDGFSLDEINILSEQLDRMYKNIQGALNEK